MPEFSRGMVEGVKLKANIDKRRKFLSRKLRWHPKAQSVHPLALRRRRARSIMSSSLRRAPIFCLTSRKTFSVLRSFSVSARVLTLGCCNGLLTSHSFSSEREAQKKLVPVYQKRRQVLKGIEKFWPVALLHNSLFQFHAQHPVDQLALSYLEDLWIERDSEEARCYTIEFVRTALIRPESYVER
jgi:hypothetical protein